MNSFKHFQKRIEYQSDLSLVLEKVCQDYKIGKYHSYKVIPIGYEDFNLILKTDQGNYFVKIFAKFRKAEECQRYVEVVEKVCASGVQHPCLLKSDKGFLYTITIDKSVVSLFVTEYILGKALLEENIELNTDEKKFLIKQAALINKIKIKPNFVYDSWAIVNLLKEYKEKGYCLKDQDHNLIAPLVKQFSQFPIKKLPQCFCHGDLTKTNVMKDNKNKLYIIDFACSNWYPRILELAVMLCELFFDTGNPRSSTLKSYKLALNEYQKYITLTNFERKNLPFFILLGHAMHLLRANYEKTINNNSTLENLHFLNCGRAGLKKIGEFPEVSRG